MHSMTGTASLVAVCIGRWIATTSAARTASGSNGSRPRSYVERRSTVMNTCNAQCKMHNVRSSIRAVSRLHPHEPIVCEHERRRDDADRTHYVPHVLGR